MKILHVAPDEKFMPFIIDVFDSIQGVENRYLLVRNRNSVSGNRPTGPGNVIMIDSCQIIGEGIAAAVSWCDCLIVHFLNSTSVSVINAMSSGKPVVWSAWGGDYELDNARLMGWATRRLFARIEKTRKKPYPGLKWWLRNKKQEYFDKQEKRKRFLSALRKVDYFSAPVRDDYGKLQKKFGGQFRARYAQLNYGSVERTFSVGPEKFTGNNILVGNSATPTNNHIEVFDRLKNIDLGDRKIIVPLSYNDRDYGNAVSEYGRKLFGERLVALMQMLPMDEYSEIVSGCAIAVMGHRRQQALGNIGAMLYKGAKVYLDKRNVIYRHFRAMGAELFMLEELNRAGESVFKPLTEMQVEKNRNILVQEWGHDTVVRNIERLINQIQG